MAKKKGSKKAKKQQAPLKTRNSKQSFWTKKEVLLSLLVIVCGTVIAFYPSLLNEFVNWDDDRNFYENQIIMDVRPGNFWQQVSLIFQTPVIGNYNPLSNFTFALEKLFFGFESPYYWHLNNLLLHLICTVLVFRLGTLLKLNWKAALFLALLFGMHPMRVESVAWVTERKDVLFGAFYLAALVLYVKNLSAHKASRVIGIYILFVLALFSKIQAVTLPLSMLAIDYLLNRQISLKLIIEKTPYFALSLGMGLLGIYFLSGEGSLESNATYPLYARGFVGTYSYTIYLIKSILPYRLSPMYPYPALVPWYFYLSAVILPIGAYGIWKAHKSGLRELVFGLLFFTVNIIFLLQILGAGQGFIADRFTYIAYFGLFYSYAYYGHLAIKSFPKYKNIILSLASVFILVYGYMTHQQTKIWKNSGTLWTHVIKYYENTTLPFRNRANYFRDNGQPKKALADYNNTIRLKPTDAQPYNSRAKLFFNSNHPDTIRMAMQDYTQALSFEPNNGEFYANRGATYARLNMRREALADFDKGIQLRPNFANGYLNRSVVYDQMGDNIKALGDIDAYLKLMPNHAEMWYHGGRLHLTIQKPEIAVDYFARAVGINPNKGIFQHEYAKTLFMTGQIVAAKQAIQKAQQLGYKINQDLLREIDSKL